MSEVLRAYKYPFCDKCCRREYFINKHVEYCESVSVDASSQKKCMK